VKRSDATVLAAVAAVALIAVFWFVVLAPKRSQASDLSSQASDLQSQLSQQQQTVATARQAQSSFRPSYHKLIVLGKAVPADSEQASLIVQLSALATRAGVSFQGLTLSQSSGAAPAPVTPPPTTGNDPSATTTSTDTSTTSTTPTTPTTDSSTAATTAALPTEASVADLPLGASVGPAGLPAMPYELTFIGGYFQISKFLHEVDSLVHTGSDSVTVSGRLVTVNGFDLAPPLNATGGSSTPGGTLEATLSVTTYVVPPGQGLTGGATPTAPAATTPSTAVPTSAPAPTATAAPTAAPAPTAP
jgi:Tfp pilus assembly protein PilO